MTDVYPKRRFAVFLALALATASMTSLTVAIKPQQAIAQSPMEMMEMMMGDGNMTNGSMMMDNNNMSMPFNMGVLVLPTMCTTPNQLLGSLTGMFGSEGMNGADGNATQQMMMKMMGQQMNMSGGVMGMQDMSESDMRQAMNFQICFPMMGEEMMQHMQDMMGNGQNSTDGMMNGMMMQ
ncbi:MAG: hypothetical protein QN720_10055 [Nitrososphaeraceae archaeon]|nr:hypothetical protein [Nitrososphaeraceae archaeon]MDW0333300.1 hypothetical protein [Nitrososphaeraceae archaeon]